MKTSKTVHTELSNNWTTIDVFDGAEKFVIEMRSKQELRHRIVEMALCTVVGAIFFALYFMMLRDTDVVASYPEASVSVMLVCFAVFLYAFATRGYKPQVGYDKMENQFWMCKLNSKGFARIVTYFPRADVLSVFVRRPEDPSKDAVLSARVKGKFGPVTLLCGSLSDIEAAHGALCEVLQKAPVIRPVRPVRPANFRGGRSIYGRHALQA